MTSHENKAVSRRSETYHERKCQIWGPHSASLLQYIVIAKYRYCKSCCCRIWFSNLGVRITSETELNVTPNRPWRQYKPKRFSGNYFVTLLRTTGACISTNLPSVWSESCFHWRDLGNGKWLPVLLCNHFGGACMKPWSSR